MIAFASEAQRLERIEGAIAVGRMGEAARLIDAELRGKGDAWESHWLLTRRAYVTLGRGRSAEALRWSRRAAAAAPNCPVVLWDRALILRAVGRDEDAAAIYRRLMRRGIGGMQCGPCRLTREDAQALLRDCRDALADCGMGAGSLGGGFGADLEEEQAALAWERRRMAYLEAKASESFTPKVA